jgi:hypothetical protein
MDLALSVHCVVVSAVAAGRQGCQVCLGVATWCGVDSGARTVTRRSHNGYVYDALPSGGVVSGDGRDAACICL